MARVHAHYQIVTHGCHNGGNATSFARHSNDDAWNRRKIIFFNFHSSDTVLETLVALGLSRWQKKKNIYIYIYAALLSVERKWGSCYIGYFPVFQR